VHRLSGRRPVTTADRTVPRLELGLDTFGDVTRSGDGGLRTQAQVIRDVVTEAVLADQLGIDFIGIGEHHSPDFAI